MFGYVTANLKELTAQQRSRYGSVYCGICRRIRTQAGQAARLGLRYDMAFLALLLMSLYEPDEVSGSSRCLAHPLTQKGWVDNEYIRYAADMNVALACYQLRDDWNDDKKVSAKVLSDLFARHLPDIENRYPRQCSAIRDCICQLAQLEQAQCSNPDLPAGCFGQLMASLLTYRQDLWAEDLAQTGFYLGRFIYLLDAALDYNRDRKKGRYNPYLAAGMEQDWEKWEEYLVLTMGRCTQSFERLPLVQDKALLDNILYSGVWAYKRRNTKEEDSHDRRSL